MSFTYFLYLLSKLKKTAKNLTSFSDHLDKQYGKRGTPKREKYEAEFEAFRLENASDIRLSTLIRIIREGLGAHLKLSVAMR